VEEINSSLNEKKQMTYCVAQYLFIFINHSNLTYPGFALFGPSGVRALPLAAGINVGGPYKWPFFSFFLSSSLLILPEGVVVGF
jgi:hypothetical protein